LIMIFFSLFNMIIMRRGKIKPKRIIISNVMIIKKQIIINQT
jgi:hypothetical protein